MNAGLVGRFNDLNEGLGGRFSDLNSGLGSRIDDIHSELKGRIDELRVHLIFASMRRALLGRLSCAVSKRCSTHG